MKKDILELSTPFAKADNYVRTAFNLYRLNLFTQKINDEIILDDQDTWDPLGDAIADAISGQITHQRSFLTSKSEDRDMLERANLLENNGFYFNEHKLVIDEVQDTTASYLVFISAIWLLSRMTKPSYASLTVENDQTLVPALNESPSNWWKNYHAEGIIRELDWIQKMNFYFQLDAYRAVEDSPNMMLRYGHFLASISLITQNLTD